MSLTGIQIDEAHAGQRLDNFLVSYFKGVPTTRIYRAIRQGEVRVNKKRVRPIYRLVVGDMIRIPPIRKSEPKALVRPNRDLLVSLEKRVLYEDLDLLIIDKPSGLPVHGGTGVRIGLIEALRVIRPQAKFIELVHRLDRETSGCLIVAKKRSVLVGLHAQLAKRKISKQYFLLVKGHWQNGECRVDVPLQKNILQSGERMVKVNQEGKAAVTIFRPIKYFVNATLLEARPFTGRTHQIRVHAAYLKHPIAGDEKYGDKSFNREMRNYGLQRLFLHSAGIYFQKENGSHLGVCSILADDLAHSLKNLRHFTAKTSPD